MRVVQAVLFAVMVASAFGAITSSENKPDMTFDEFKRAYGRKYMTPAEEAKRRDIYAANMVRLARHRQENPWATFAVNRNADRTLKEITARPKTTPGGHSKISYVRGKDQVIPTSIDWRTKGAVSRVYDEQQCGTAICGFAFAANTEGAWVAAGFKLNPLSPMPAMLCSYPGDCGCPWHQTWDYFINSQNGNVQTEASWPWNSTQCESTNNCDLNGRQFGAKITKMVEIASNEDAMAESVATNGPIGVVVNAEPWQFYTGGVLTKCSSQQAEVDHVGAVVGYNDGVTPPYWILKNTWGTKWGEEGYIMIEKGKNLCDITYEPLTVQVAISEQLN